MIIIPKVAETDIKNIEYIKDCIKISEGVEIQLLSDNLLKGFENSCKLIECFPHIKYVVLHMPFSMVNLCYIHSNRVCEDKFIELIVECIKYSYKTGIKIDILTHVAVQLYEFLGNNGIIFLNHLVQMVQGTNVGFLLENSIINLAKGDTEDDVLTGIFRLYSSDKVKFCLDLCHFQASEFVMKKHFELNDVLLKNLKNVHFSMTLEEDGYINKERTHGRVHISKGACIRDLEYLKEKGADLNKLNLITEINEEDYSKRPDMHKEINYLIEIKKNNI